MWVAKTRGATVANATWGRLDTAIMKMWRHSVSKDESLDPLVELLFLACISMVNIIPCYFYSLLSLVLSSSLS